MKTYRQSLDELHFTREEKNAMVDRLTAGEGRGSGKVRSIRRTVTVGVAAALLMTMGVGAAVTLTPAGEVFASIFGDSPAQTEIMDRMGVPIGASDTADGVTITADAIIGDTYSYAVVYSIARDDGQPLAEDLTPLGGANGPLPLTFEQSDTFIGMLGGSHGTAYFYDADPADNAIQYVEMMTADTPIEPGTATATFQNLYLRGEDIQDRTLLAEGSWKIRFQFHFPDSGVSLDAGQTFQLNGMEATLDGVTISPLSIQVDYTVREKFQMEDQENGKMSASNSAQVKKFLSSLPISVNFTDGTSRDLDYLGGSLDPEGDRTLLAEGNWKIRFQFNFPDSGVSLEAGQTFQLNGMEATLDGVTISPLSIQVDYTVWEELVWDHQDQADGQMSEHDREQSYRFFESLPVTVNFTDGTALDLSGNGGGIRPKDGKTVCQKGRVFEEILDLSTVESVTVGDVTLPVEAE